MTPENAAIAVARPARLTPENAELLAECADHLEHPPLTEHSPPLSSCARRVCELVFCEGLVLQP